MQKTQKLTCNQRGTLEHMVAEESKEGRTITWAIKQRGASLSRYKALERKQCLSYVGQTPEDLPLFTLTELGRKKGQPKKETTK